MNAKIRIYFISLKFHYNIVMKILFLYLCAYFQGVILIRRDDDSFNILKLRKWNYAKLILREEILITIYVCDRTCIQICCISNLMKILLLLDKMILIVQSLFYFINYKMLKFFNVCTSFFSCFFLLKFVQVFHVLGIIEK